MKNDHRSKFSNLSNWKEEAWKKSGLQRDSNPWPPSYLRLPGSNPVEALRWSFFTFLYNRSSKMNYFIELYFINFTPSRFPIIYAFHFQESESFISYNQTKLLSNFRMYFLRMCNDCPLGDKVKGFGIQFHFLLSHINVRH